MCLTLITSDFAGESLFVRTERTGRREQSRPTIMQLDPVGRGRLANNTGRPVTGGAAASIW